MLVQAPGANLHSAESSADLATLLKSFRVRAGLSQQMLADRALISVQAVSALERGYRKVPYRHTLDRIADALALPDDTRATLERLTRRVRGSRLVEHDGRPAHNFPRQLTSFFGRAEVVRELCELLESAPLVNIVGTGGAGKTRVAVAVGTASLSRFPGGAWFVELDPLSDPQLVTQAVAGVLRVQESANRPLLETVLSFLQGKRMLLVFDNCEHVISGVREVIGSLMRECPSVALLATSRQALSIVGERMYRIPPLAVPPRGTPPPQEALQYGAIELFVDRVRSTNARFDMTSENVEPIVEICRRLDGLPLAIELAAARCAVLSPGQICQRLDRVFDLLTTEARVALPRHQTMRAVIDWSYEMLSLQARLLFDRLAIFAGGFTLQTAADVCVDDSVAQRDVLELLTSLIGQSLVVVDFERGDARYSLLEATRQYGLEKLAARHEQHALSQRHALAFLRVAQRLDRDWYEAQERSWYREAEAELDNCRVALAWSLADRRDAHAGRLLAAALARVWYSLAPVEGRRWVRMALDSVDQTPVDVVAQLHIADAELCGSLGEYKAALASAQQALQVPDNLDELQLARAKQAAGSALGALGRGAEAEMLLNEALIVARRLDNRRMQALLLGDLGTAFSRRGEVDGARRYYADALSYYVALGLERPAASIAGSIAELEFAAGDAATALQRAEEARAGHEATQNRRSMANDLCNMAAYFIALNCFDDARAYALRALTAVRDVRQTVLTAYVLQHLAAVAALQNDAAARGGRSERAAMLLGFVDGRLASLEAQREYTELQEYERVVAALRDCLDRRFEGLLRLGTEWSEDHAVAVARAL